MNKTNRIISFLFGVISLLFIDISVLQANLAPYNTGHDHHEPKVSPYNAYPFQENKGQLPNQVLYKMNKGSKIMYIEEQGFLWHIMDSKELGHAQSCMHDQGCSGSENHPSVRNHVYRVDFYKANSNIRKKSLGPSHRYSNYIIGSDESKWASEVRDYQAFELKDIYDNIDLKMYQEETSIKYDWIVHPGADPDVIVLDFKYLDKVYIKDGDLYQVNSIDTIIEKAPYVYQIINGKKKKIKSKFKLTKNKLSYKIGKYDHSLDLIIDPILVFSSYTGSTEDNWGSTATPGLNGEFFAGGITFGIGYPTTTGAFQTNFGGGIIFGEGITDITISKFTSDGSDLIYSTYIGGRGSEFAHSLIVNSRNELVIYGTTSSDNYPTTNGAYSRSFFGGDELHANGISYLAGSDIVISILNAAGTGLVGSTYIGGSSNDGINNDGFNMPDQNDIAVLNYNYGDFFRGEIIVDDNDNILVASCTQSDDFPLSSQIYSSKGGIQDACVFSLDRQCSSLIFSTYLGGSKIDAAYGLKVNSIGEIIVTGGTESTDFPTKNAISPSYNGGTADGFILKLNPAGNALMKSTYIGTSAYDQGYLIDLGVTDDRIYILGQSNGNMPVSPNVWSNPTSGQFIHIYNEDLSALDYSTRFGSNSGDVDISLTALMVDVCGRIFISGWGGTNNRRVQAINSTTFGLTTTIDAYSSVTDGSDFYFLVLEKDFEDILYATFFGLFDLSSSAGQDHVDGGTSRFSKNGLIYQAVCGGCTGRDDFPTTSKGYSTTNNSSNCNLAAVKFDFELEDIVAAADMVLDTFGCAPYNAEFINLSRGASSYCWDFGDGDTSLVKSPNHDYDSLGFYPVRMIAKTDNNCLDPDTLFINILIIASEPPNVDTILECEKNYVDIKSSRANSNSRYLWHDGITTRGRRVKSSGWYSVTATESNCVYIDSFLIKIISPEPRLRDSIYCGPQKQIIDIDPRAENILWSTGSDSIEITISEPGQYTVAYNIESCVYYDTAFYSFASIPVVAIEGDSIICGTTSVTLSVNTNGHNNIDTYEWSSGATGTSIEVMDPKTYSVTVTTDSTCMAVSEYRVSKIDEFIDLINGDTLVCKESSINVDFSEYEELSKILWSDGSTQFIRTFDKTGTYRYTLSNVCQTVNGVFNLEVSPFTNLERPVYVPNAFTPNEDLINDIFKPELASQVNIISYRMLVFDRWGNKVFESQDVNIGWDGTFKGILMDPAIFAYFVDIEYFVCEESINQIIKGDVNLQN